MTTGTASMMHTLSMVEMAHFTEFLSYLYTRLGPSSGPPYKL